MVFLGKVRKKIQKKIQFSKIAPFHTLRLRTPLPGLSEDIELANQSRVEHPHSNVCKPTSSQILLRKIELYLQRFFVKLLNTNQSLERKWHKG